MGTSDKTLTIDVTNYDANGYSLDWDNITITPDPDLYVEGDIIARKGGEMMNVTEIIHEQKLQIQVLTDMIEEMLQQGNFDLEWNLEERMEKQRFLNKLSDT
tara:strand:- start:1659 stop:1964 length:306 start_codon:yes stop_codon:yes gene_type:complete